MHRNGIGSAIFHARFGLITPYMGEEWMENTEAGILEAERLGMKVYLYDENNWPSGVADGKVLEGHPEFVKTSIYLADEIEVGESGVTKQLTGEPCYVVAVPADKQGFPATSVNLAGFIEDGQLNWKPEAGKWTVYVIAVRSTATPTYRGMADLHDKEAMARFIDFTHREYANRFGQYFGRTVLGIFTDEPGMNYAGPEFAVWTRSLPEEFNWRHGYDLIGTLPAIFRDMGEPTAKIRCDFYDTATQLYVEAYFKQIYDYCEEVRLHSTGHVMNEGEFTAHARMQGDFFRGAKFMHYGGLDHLHELTWPVPGGPLNNLLSAKFASSAAHIFEKPVVFSECFGIAAHWGINLRSLKRLADWEVLLGVNEMGAARLLLLDPGIPQVGVPAGRVLSVAILAILQQVRQLRLPPLLPLPRGQAHSRRGAALSDSQHVDGARSRPERGHPESGGLRSTTSARRCCGTTATSISCPRSRCRRPTSSGGKIVVRNDEGKELEEYGLLVIPDVTALTAETIPALLRHLESGGKVLVAGRLPSWLWGEAKSGFCVEALKEAYESKPGQVIFLNPGMDWDDADWEKHMDEAVGKLTQANVRILEGGKPCREIIHLYHRRG